MFLCLACAPMPGSVCLCIFCYYIMPCVPLTFLCSYAMFCVSMYHRLLHMSCSVFLCYACVLFFRRVLFFVVFCSHVMLCVHDMFCDHFLFGRVPCHNAIPTSCSLNLSRHVLYRCSVLLSYYYRTELVRATQYAIVYSTYTIILPSTYISHNS